MRRENNVQVTSALRYCWLYLEGNNLLDPEDTQILTFDKSGSGSGSGPTELLYTQRNEEYGQKRKFGDFSKKNGRVIKGYFSTKKSFGNWEDPPHIGKNSQIIPYFFLLTVSLFPNIALKSF